MAKSKAATIPADGDEDLLGGAPSGAEDDLLGGAAPAAPAKKAKSKSKPKAEAAPAKKAPAKKAAAPKAEAAPAKKAKVKKAETVERSERGQGAFYFDPDEKAALAKKIGASKKAASTKELAEKHGVATWQIRRAIAEVLVPEGKATLEKVGNTLQYTGA